MRYYRVSGYTEKEIEEHRSRQEPIKINVKGQPFTCKCGGDTFHRPLTNIYVFRCNSCGESWAEDPL